MPQTTVVLPQGDYAVGTRTFSATVPGGVASVMVSLDRVDWTDPGVKVALSIDVSVDGGGTWSFLVGCTAEGGPPVKQNIMSIRAFLPSGTQRRVRGTLTIAGNVLRTQATMDLV